MLLNYFKCRPGKRWLSLAIPLLFLAGGLWLFSGSTEARSGSRLPIAKSTTEFTNAEIAPRKIDAAHKEAIMAKAVSVAVPFVENAGQFAAEVKFAVDLFTGRFFLTGNELVYSLRQREKSSHVQPGKSGRMAEAKRHSVPGQGIVFKEYFVDKKGNRIDLKSNGERRAKTVVSYFKGKKLENWYTGVASYQGVSLGEVYPGVEVKLKASGRNVEKVFYVKPQGSVAEIKIGMAGVSGLKVAGDGRLLLNNDLGELAMRKPIAWQEIAGMKHEVKISYRLLTDHLYGFAIAGKYDKNHPLIIDPDLDMLLASTFLGNFKDESCESLALDSAGNIYILVNNHNTKFINHEDSSFDIIIYKLNNNLNECLATITWGGPGWDERGYDLTVDKTGNVYVVGMANHGEPPAFLFDNVLVLKLDRTFKTTAEWRLYLYEDNFGYSIALDKQGNVYVTGITWSANFPTTEGAFDRTFNDSGDEFDIFVSKLDNGLTTLLASTFLGGISRDVSYSLALDSSGDVYLSGYTESADFPTTAGAYDQSKNGENTDAFVSKLNGGLTGLLASTFLGGISEEYCNSLALDNRGTVYVAGMTVSADFPTTGMAYDRILSGTSDAFVSRLNGDLTKVLSSTYLGGKGSDSCDSLALDSQGAVYVAGGTTSADFPTTDGAYDRVLNGRSDAFVCKLNGDLTKVLHSTYLGGKEDDGCSYLALGSKGNLYLAGHTWSTDFPTTSGAHDKTYYGQGDTFVSKLSNTLADIIVIEPDGGEKWEVGSSQDITWEASNLISRVNIDYSADNGGHWLRVVAGTENDGRYTWTVPNTPSPACLVRISDANDAQVSDTSDNPFSILIGIDLAAERREIKAFTIVRQYGRIQFLVQTPSDQVTQYRIMRRLDNADFVLLKTISPSELQNNQFQLQDKYLEKDKQYTYFIEAYNQAGQVIGRSSDKTI